MIARAVAAEMTTIYDGAFPRLPADIRVGAPPGQSVAEHCPGDAKFWPDATAQLTVRQDATSRMVTVAVQNARPGTLYTLWVRLMGQTADGTAFGGNPMMKTTSPDAPIGFMSDINGNGKVTVALDYPVVGGAAPFDRYHGFDAKDSVYDQTPPRAIPVAVVGKAAGAPFTIRLSSHCADNLSHGLASGPHEAWFDWMAP